MSGGKCGREGGSIQSCQNPWALASAPLQVMLALDLPALMVVKLRQVPMWTGALFSGSLFIYNSSMPLLWSPAQSGLQ